MKIINNVKDFEDMEEMDLKFDNGIVFCLMADEDNIGKVDLEFGITMNGDLENIYQEGMLYAKQCATLSALMDKADVLDTDWDSSGGSDSNQWLLITFKLQDILKLLGKELTE